VKKKKEKEKKKKSENKERGVPIRNIPYPHDPLKRDKERQFSRFQRICKLIFHL